MNKSVMLTLLIIIITKMTNSWIKLYVWHANGFICRKYELDKKIWCVYNTISDRTYRNITVLI